jgi:transposase
VPQPPGAIASDLVEREADESARAKTQIVVFKPNGVIKDELTGRQWERLLPLLPPQKSARGRPSTDHRTVVNAILWVLRTGAPWRDLPSDAGVCWKTASSRFYRWTASGVWQKILDELQRDADKHVWRPDVFGSVLFLVSSAYTISALGVGFWRPQWRELTWSIAWLNMLGSVAFMASAIASFVLPSTDTLIDPSLANAGTFLGAMCFFVGAALMLPAWQASARSSRRP